MNHRFRRDTDQTQTAGVFSFARWAARSPGDLEHRRQLLTLIVAGALALVMGSVLVSGFRLATRVRADVFALQSASALQSAPLTLTQQLNTLRDRLEARVYSGQALSDTRTTVRAFDGAIGRLASAGLDSPALPRALSLWHEYGPVLDPILGFDAQPYVDTDEGGSSFSKEGRAYYANVKRAQLFAAENQKALQAELGSVASDVATRTAAAATRLRTLLSAGVLTALVLAGIAAYFQYARARQERAARRAEEEKRDILKTVREGFFLLDADYRIGSVWSDALAHIFGREDFAGLSFESLLEGLVAPETLTTATKYIKLLWGDRAQENLMKSINPLGQLEISIDTGSGGKDTRYLQFDFHRVMGPQGVKYVLCSVGDITSSVLLSRELAQSQQNANAQLDMMLGMLQVDPLQLNLFLDGTEAGLKLVNSILKEPARTDAEFRRKLGGLFRELHSIKSEASALSLLSIAQRVHALEDEVSELKDRPELSGGDFLPLVLKLDELIAHLRGVREMAARLPVLKEPVSAALGSAAPATYNAAAGPDASVDELSPVLNAMAARLAKEHRKPFRLIVRGLAEVPAMYSAMVKDCIIQMLRNSAVHGIESADSRRAHSKEAAGLVKVEFHRSQTGYELVFEDDGAGISPEQLKSAAVRKGILTAAEAAALDSRAIMALIFRAGFSTQDGVTMDAGRGVGMDVVAKTVYGLGGKIGVSTSPGKFTRFKITLPPTVTTNPAVA